MKKFFIIICVIFTGFAILSPKPSLAADFNPNQLISDGEFINVNSWSVSDIQNFLNSMGGMLKDFSQDGRSAAQIIYDAAHGHGEASGPPPDGCWDGVCINTSTGSINPKAILVSLQKEQSLVTRTDYSQRALDWAMGYGCPDSAECNPKYQGFTNQVEWASWQFRYIYEKAKLNAVTYRIGSTYHISNTYPNPYGGPPSQDVTIANAATSSLYNYTPHVYNGNYNFWRLYNQWFEQKLYDAQLTYQSAYPSLNKGETASMEIRFRNTGSTTWEKTGANPVRLALDKYWADQTAFKGSLWLSENRIVTFEEASVAPGEIGTFKFQIRVPENTNYGTHKLYVRLVSENKTWFEPDTGGAAWWNINVLDPAGQYQAELVSQSAYPSLFAGDEANMSITFKNIGTKTWSNTTNPLRLALDKYADENFLKQFKNNWVSDYRIANLSTATVSPGQSATFNFKIKAPSDMHSGNYRFHVRLVAEGYTWFEPNTAGAAWWSINVSRKPLAQYISQSAYPTLERGQDHILEIKFKNTSDVTWKTQGTNPVRLALDKYWASKTAWQGTGWISPDRISVAQEGDIAPGQTGTYKIPIHVPLDMPSGEHKFFVRLVAENLAWFEPDTSGAGWWKIIVK